MNVKISPSKQLGAIFIIAILSIITTGRPVLAGQQHVPTGKDAFLHYQVDSTDELIAALKDNLRLRRNYAQHFGISEKEILDFIQRTLVPYHLAAARDVTTYGVTKAGRIYPVTTHLKKGTLVWATRSGLPILKWACANPLTKNLPGTLLKAKPKPTMGSQFTRHKPQFASEKSAEMPLTSTDAPSDDIAVPPLSTPLAIDVNTPALQIAHANPLLTLPATPAVVSMKYGNSAIALIPILIGVLKAGGNSVGSGGIMPVSTPTLPDSPVIATPPPVVPESSGLAISLAVFSTPGFAWILSRRRKVIIPYLNGGFDK